MQRFEGVDVSESLACPGCGSTRTFRAPASLASGRVVAGCKTCGCHWLANPPETTEILSNQEYDRAAYDIYTQAKRVTSVDSGYRSTLAQIGRLIRSDGRALFDLGAGAGEFLALAAESGFEPHGNELAPGAIALAKERTGIDLHFGDLSSIEGGDHFDAVTMWCVLAHVTDPDELLRQTLRVLKPGGVLFLQTPRWSAMDSMALGAVRATGGRFARVLDRRVNEFHMTLNSVQGLTAKVGAQGFDVVEVRPRARYSLKTDAYLTSLGLSPQASRAAARVLDAAVDRDMMFRNVLDLYARKPIAPSRA